MLHLSNTEMADFYANKTNLFDLVENEYLVIQNSNEEIIDKFCYQHNEFKPVRFKTIKSAISGEIKPRNLEQELAFNMLQDEKTKIKVLTGPYGSGKAQPNSTSKFQHPLVGQPWEKEEKGITFSIDLESQGLY